ncbi:ATP-binding protein [Ramlibacter sp.]|uniref:ATP-binding protein n=1 Tax=Ramlibacter sp. TaxID=1917967 RepID=UPI0035ADCF54
MALHIVMGLALVETLVLAAVLLAWAERVRGARLLTLFLLGVAIWVTGNELPNVFGLSSAPVALALVSTIPLTAAAFLHFCLVFCRVPVASPWPLRAAYGLAAASTLLAWVVPPARFVHFPPFTGVDYVALPGWSGWVNALAWAALAAAGVGVLVWQGWRVREPMQRRQIAALTVSCGWGMVCMSGYGFAALQIPVYPWQVLALPAYPVILVYGILRYQVFVANAWARRALVWALLVGAGLLAVPLTLALPLESRWLTGALVAVLCLALSGPVRGFAERIVYPGGTASAADLQAWRAALAGAESEQALAARAASLISDRVGLRVDARVQMEDLPPAGQGAALADAPALLCFRTADGWQVRLQGWDAAPPGPRHLAELFAGVLAEAAQQLEHARAAESRERERQLQARLAELGALAASVAHDLRNPLNIIAMAVATAPADTRREVADQVQRISRLAEDLLDYAKPWQLRRADLDLAAQVRQAVRRAPGVELGAGFEAPLPLRADPARLDQALGNLFANARAAAGTRRVCVEAERDALGVQLHVCDDGPGVPEDLRERLFEPFASRSPGGTGLGLAIVARIMAAHGGDARLTQRPPWSTCFTLRFPSLP